MGSGVGKGGSSIGVGGNGMVTGVGVGWGVTVGSAAGVGADATAVAALSSAIRRISCSESAHPKRNATKPAARTALMLFFTDPPRRRGDTCYAPGHGQPGCANVISVGGQVS